MIRNRKDFNEYINADAKAMEVDNTSLKGRIICHFTNPRWRFIKILRKAELYKNQNGIISKILYAYYFIKYKRTGIRLGFSIPLNVFDKGVSFPHYGTIVISKYAKFGVNARIHVCVNVGAHNGNLAPIVGDNCYVGPGAKIYGGIRLGNNVMVGANSVVNKSFHEDNIILAGIPAKIIRRLDPSQI